jgi:hypothetical protein
LKLSESCLIKIEEKKKEQEFIPLASGGHLLLLLLHHPALLSGLARVKFVKSKRKAEKSRKLIDD